MHQTKLKIYSRCDSFPPFLFSHQVQNWHKIVRTPWYTELRAQVEGILGRCTCFVLEYLGWKKWVFHFNVIYLETAKYHDLLVTIFIIIFTLVKKYCLVKTFYVSHLFIERGKVNKTKRKNTHTHTPKNHHQQQKTPKNPKPKLHP